MQSQKNLGLAEQNLKKSDKKACRNALGSIMKSISIIALVFVFFLISCENTTTPQKSEGYWEINGTKLHYVMTGQGEPIIVLHGGPGGNLSSKLELAQFAPDNRWIFYDQRGSSPIKKGFPFVWLPPAI